MTDVPPEHPPETDAQPRLVEEIRHEIEEVVEHVPKPVRWTVRKLVLLATVVVVGLVLLTVASIILYYARRTELVAQELTLYLNHTLAARSNVQIEFKDIRGNPLSRVRLVEPRVVFRDGGSPLLRAPWIEIGYEPWSLLHGDTRSVDVVLQSPIVTLGRNRDGTLRLPTWKTAGRSAPGRPSGEAGLRLRVHDGTVVLPIQQPPVSGMELDVFASTGLETQATIRTLTWREGPFETHHLSLTGRLAAGDSLRFEIQKLTTDDLALSATGGYRKGERRKQLHADVRRLSWAWLARVTNNNSFDVPGEGAVHVDAVGDSVWRGAFSSRLTWRDLGFDGDGRFAWNWKQLRVEPLDARSEAGHLRGFVTWSDRGWSVGGDVQDGKPERWGAIGIPDWPAGVLNGRFEYLVDTHRGASDGTLRATLGGSTLAGWRADSAGVVALLPAHGVRTFDVTAVRRGGRFALHGATTDAGWRGTYEAAALPLDEWPDGRASGIRGVLDHAQGGIADEHGVMSVTGDLAGHGTDWFGMHTAKWTLDHAQGALLPKPDLTADAALTDMMFLGLHFDSTASPIHLGDRNLDLLGVRAHATDTLLALAGRADWDEHGWRMALGRAEARSSQFHWTAEPPVRLSGDPHGVTFDRLAARDSTSRLDVAGRWAAPGGSYDWTGHVQGLDLSRIGLPPDWGLDGDVDGVLRVTGRSGDPHWAFEGEAARPAFGGHRGDSLALNVAGEAGRVDLKRGVFRIGAGTLAADGQFSSLAHPWPDSLSGTAVERWLLSAGQWSGTASAQGFPIERVTGLIPAAHGWTGGLDGTATFAGSPAQPRADLTASVASLAWRDFSLARLDVRAHYRDDALDIDELKGSRGALEAVAQGTIPVRLAVGKPAQPLDQPMALTLRVVQGDLKFVPRLVPQIATASGTLEAQAQIGGTAKQPVLSGEGRVTNGSMRLAERVETLTRLSAAFHLSQTALTVDSLVAHQGDKGLVRAHGTVALDGLVPKSYRFDLGMSDFTATEPGLYAVDFDGDFQVADGPRIRGAWLPFVTGRARVRKAVILIDFANQTESEQLAATNEPLYWLYRIDLTAPGGVHWQPPDGDIEFSLDLTAEQTPTELRLFGDMQSVRGTYYFLSNRFAVDHANLTFDNVGGVDPQIDAQATTHIVPTGGTNVGAGASLGTDAPHDVTVTISGRAREPSIAFSTSPSDWDQNEILQQLTVLRFRSNTGPLAADPFDSYITRALNRTLSSEMSRAFNGYVSEWVLDREQGGLFQGQGEVIFGVGSQLTRNLTLRYRQVLPGLGRETLTPQVGITPFQRDIEAEYRLNRFFLVSSELTQRRTIAGSVTTPTSGAPDFNVSLKARWEY